MAALPAVKRRISPFDGFAYLTSHLSVPLFLCLIFSCLPANSQADAIGHLPRYLDMPITPLHPLMQIDQDEFAAIAYDVMEVAFATHREMGRLFEEPVYQQELANRISKSSRSQ